MSTTSEKAAVGGKSQVVNADADIDKLLNREASAFQREIEVERILKAFKLKFVALRVP
jgi:DnaJ family protein C protein 8